MLDWKVRSFSSISDFNDDLIRTDDNFTVDDKINSSNLTDFLKKDHVKIQIKEHHDNNNNNDNNWWKVVLAPFELESPSSGILISMDSIC